VCSSGVGNSITVTSSLIYSNSANNVDNGYGGAFDLRNGTYDIYQSEVFGNTAGKGGGAIAISFGSLTISQSKIYGNTANYGGGLSLNAESAVINQSLIKDNEALGYGGGMYVWRSATVTNSSIVNNTAGTTGGGIGLRDETLTIVNSTISGNSADQNGGGIHTSNQSVARLANVTVADNTADANVTDDVEAMGGGFYTDDNSQIQAKNSIVAKNHDLKAAPIEIVASDCYGDFVSDGYNLIGVAGAFCTLSGNMAGMQYGSGGNTLDPNWDRSPCISMVTIISIQSYSARWWIEGTPLTAVITIMPCSCRTNCRKTPVHMEEVPRWATHHAATWVPLNRSASEGSCSCRKY